jgi:hypothetical protein
MAYQYQYPQQRTIGLSLNDLMPTPNTTNLPQKQQQLLNQRHQQQRQQQQQQQQPTYGQSAYGLSASYSQAPALATSAVDVDVNSADYLAELRKLLVKSKGTTYESTLQKFIDMKNVEMADTLGRNRSPSPTSRSQRMNASANVGGAKVGGAMSAQTPRGAGLSAQTPRASYIQTPTYNNNSIHYRPTSPTAFGVNNNYSANVQANTQANRQQSLSPTNRQRASTPNSYAYNANANVNVNAQTPSNKQSNKYYFNFSDIRADNNARPRSPGDLSVSNMSANTQQTQRLDISQLDSIAFANHNDVLRNNLPRADRQKWLDELAQPLDRNSWKESTHGWFGGGKRVSTNTSGRQRPPSWVPLNTSTSTHAGQTNAFSTESYANQTLAQSQQLQKTLKVQAQAQALGQSGNASGNASVSVSVKDFDNWLQKNGDWKAAVREKVCRLWVVCMVVDFGGINLTVCVFV